ncbi:MAG: dTMP kinase [Alphaproteobacteria bacterium]|nr:dTMP kinase [Alphaproteobacteria bacterium]
MKGLFITFEGGEGTGKSTQIKLLEEYLKEKGEDVVTSKEPGGTEVGLEIRKLLVCGDKDKFDATAEALLYFADRHIHLTKKIWPAMEKGAIVLSDRFADSTMAYQYYGYNKRVSKETLNTLYDIAVGQFKPDLTIILDIDPEKGLARSFAKAKNMDVKELRFEGRDLEFHHNLRNGFLEIAKAEPERCVVLNADKTIEDLHTDIIKVVEEKLGL